MDLRLIKTDSEYQVALSRLVKLIDKNPPGDSQEADEIELLGMLIENYEEQTYPPLTSVPDPIEEIEFHPDRPGLTRRDLIPILGSESRVSEILKRKRPLTLAMI